MSENSVDQHSESNMDSSLVNPSLTAGQMLKQARSDAGLHIAALAVSLRVPVKRIEALENGQMDLLPDMVFVRALTASICQTLKIDPLPILDKLPKVTVPRLNRDDVALNTPIESNTVGKRALPTDAVTLPWITGVAVLCIAAAVMYFLPKDFSFAAQEVTMPPQNVTESAAGQSKEQQVLGENSVVNNSPISTPSAVLTDNAAATSTSDVLASSGSQTINTPTPALGTVTNSVQPSTAIDSVVASVNNIVLFEASSDAWVEVKNSKGNTVFKKLLKAGESAGASGAVPLTVIVGRADVTKVQVRGKPVDLALIAKSNVARFEVN